ncbi:unnamed protein product [Chrysodeixis includens]|uniref:Uncharacterized protein n=1 Tax=Chrysodeixis includens TaxID=689277 RepID=A0A9N8KPR5_CHRIL|nr:unnamed protein product [Chrysodeixis includens]
MTERHSNGFRRITIAQTIVGFGVNRRAGGGLQALAGEGGWRACAGRRRAPRAPRPARQPHSAPERRRRSPAARWPSLALAGPRDLSAPPLHRESSAPLYAHHNSPDLGKTLSKVILSVFTK